MIVYGTKARPLAKETLIEKCTSCGTMNSVDLTLFQKYAHVFWIPFFPTGKTGVSQCQHCKKVLKLNEMPEPMRVSYENLKLQSKTPVWTFAGVGLVILLIAMITINERQKDAKNAKLIVSPQKGDVFEVKKEGNYTLYKVSAVSGDTVFILFNQYETNKATGLSGLKKKGADAYLDDPAPFLKSELKALFDKGEIIDIDRD